MVIHACSAMILVNPVHKWQPDRTREGLFNAGVFTYDVVCDAKKQLLEDRAWAFIRFDQISPILGRSYGSAAHSDDRGEVGAESLERKYFRQIKGGGEHVR